jgi:magnesium chelatase family protein
VQRYQNKLSGPFLDRIDMHINVPALAHDALQENRHNSETSEVVKQRVIEARWRQQRRRKHLNAQLTHREIEQDCRLAASDQALLEKTMNKLRLSARAYHRILKLARTIADLEQSEQIAQTHLIESISYRQTDHSW